MTWHVATEGGTPTAYDSEAEADAAAIGLLAAGRKHVVVWEMGEETP